MGALLSKLGSTVLSGMIAALFAVLGKLFTQRFFERTIARTFISLADMLAKKTSTTVDDRAVDDMREQLAEYLE